jgi:hypothetical protein
MPFCRWDSRPDREGRRLPQAAKRAATESVGHGAFEQLLRCSPQLTLHRRPSSTRLAFPLIDKPADVGKLNDLRRLPVVDALQALASVERAHLDSDDQPAEVVDEQPAGAGRDGTGRLSSRSARANRSPRSNAYALGCSPARTRNDCVSHPASSASVTSCGRSWLIVWRSYHSPSAPRTRHSSASGSTTSAATAQRVALRLEAAEQRASGRRPRTSRGNGARARRRRRAGLSARHSQDARLARWCAECCEASRP